MRNVFFLTTCCMFSLSTFGQIPRPITHEMHRFNVKTVLLFDGKSTIQSPQWSPDNTHIVFKTGSKWRKIDLKQVSLIAAEWNHQAIGINTYDVVDSIPHTELLPATFASSVITSKGVVYQFQSTPKRTTQLLRIRGKKKTILWETGGDSCHSLVLSPNEEFIAFISDMNGLMVQCLNKKMYKKHTPIAALNINKALHLFAKKDSRRVEHLLNHAAKKDSSSAEAIVWKAYLKNYVGSREDAIRLMNRAVTKNSQNAFYFFMRGQLLFAAGNSEGAIDSYTYYTTLKPYDYHGYEELGLIYEHQGIKDLACTAYTHAINNGSTRAKEKTKSLCQ